MLPKGVTFRKKPVEVEMMQWTGANLEQCLAFIGPNQHSTGVPRLLAGTPNLSFWCWKSQASVVVAPGDWIARERDGSGFYPIAEDAQLDSFELATDDPPTIEEMVKLRDERAAALVGRVASDVVVIPTSEAPPGLVNALRGIPILPTEGMALVSWVIDRVAPF